MNIEPKIGDVLKYDESRTNLNGWKSYYLIVGNHQVVNLCSGQIIYHIDFTGPFWTLV
jgi:hypothetical protein